MHVSLSRIEVWHRTQRVNEQIKRLFVQLRGRPQPQSLTTWPYQDGWSCKTGSSVIILCRWYMDSICTYSKPFSVHFLCILYIVKRVSLPFASRSFEVLWKSLRGQCHSAVLYGFRIICQIFCRRCTRIVTIQDGSISNAD